MSGASKHTPFAYAVEVALPFHLRSLPYDLAVYPPRRTLARSILTALRDLAVILAVGLVAFGWLAMACTR